MKSTGVMDGINRSNGIESTGVMDGINRSNEWDQQD